MYNALVLLGQSGAGKDAIANSLCRDNPGMFNTKFSVIAKHLFADWLGLDDDDLNNKKLRTEYTFNVRGYQTEMSLLDVLDVMFRGCSGTALERDKFAYTMHRIGDRTPIFTDVRSRKEVTFIREHYNALTIRIYADHIPMGISDDNLSEVWSNLFWNTDCRQVVREKDTTLTQTLSDVKRILYGARGIKGYNVKSTQQPVKRSYEI